MRLPGSVAPCTAVLDFSALGLFLKSPIGFFFPETGKNSKQASLTGIPRARRSRGRGAGSRDAGRCASTGRGESLPDLVATVNGDGPWGCSRGAPGQHALISRGAM